MFFLAAGIAVWSFGRHASRTTLWERLALLVLVAGSISVIRNILFFGLFALMVMPVWLAIGARAEAATEPAEGVAETGVAATGESSTAPRADRRRGRINAGLAFTAAAAVLIASVATLVRPASALELNYQRPALLAAVQRATQADPSLKVLAEDRFADWLLWRDPALSGRIANDVRFELLTAGQLNRINAVFGVIGPNWKQGARGYRLIVMDKKYVPNAAFAFVHEAGSRSCMTTVSAWWSCAARGQQDERACRFCPASGAPLAMSAARCWSSWRLCCRSSSSGSLRWRSTSGPSASSSAKPRPRPTPPRSPVPRTSLPAPPPRSLTPRATSPRTCYRPGHVHGDPNRVP